MAYSDFKTLSQVATDFQLQLQNQSKLFFQIPPIAASNRLKQTLEDQFELAIAIDTEKARSELIVTPILLEIRNRFPNQVSYFSGVNLNIDSTVGLNGECDFLLSKSAFQLEPLAPIVTLVEAKNNDISSDLGQCAAQMIGAQKLNQDEHQTILGAVTTGNLWRFMQLNQQTLQVDLTEYVVPLQLAEILGILASPFQA